MCLYLREKQPQVAKEDIIVLKYVYLHKKGIISPFQRSIIPVNEVMTAYPEKENIEFCSTDLLGNNIYSLGGGAIHAKLIKEEFPECEGRKAIIPAGTKYWVNLRGDEIAARSMIVTDINWNKGDNKVSESLFEEILENAPEVNGIRIGDYLLENGDYTRPRKGLSEDKVVGIVAGFHDGEPLIAALTFFVGAYDRRYNSKFGEYYNSNKDAIKVFNGRIITKGYKEGNRDSRFEAFEACINYRKDKDEEWYFGAAGEVATMIDNCIYLNAAHQITGLGFIIWDEWYHSCSEYGYTCSWDCTSGVGDVNCCWRYKDYKDRIVPFLAYKNNKVQNFFIIKLYKQRIDTS